MVISLKNTNGMIDIYGLSLFLQLCLLAKFKMPENDKFNESSYSTTYLKMYVQTMYPKGIIEELMAQLF